MRKLIVLLLVISLLLSLFACGNAETPTGSISPESTPMTEVTPTATAQTADSSTDDLEILRAISYGFVPEELQCDWDKTVTYEQFCTMLGGMVALTDDSLSGEWETLTANLPDETIIRKEAMLACLLAGQLMGLTEATDYDEEQAIDELGEFDTNSKLYPEWNKSVTISTDGNGVWDDYIIAGIFYGLREVSLISRLPLFTLDGSDLRLGQNLTREEAILAAVRLYESDRTTAKAVEKLYRSQLLAGLNQMENTPELQSIISAADERRESIINSKSNIVKSDTYIQGETYTGTAYYVSVSGDDSADGLTPETAWATINKVNETALCVGDAVFFARGGVWRGQLLSQDGVTYSAYGEGQKPRIYGSPENGAGAQKWSLLEGTDNIWVFYKDMYDTGGIVFNEGEDYASRMVGFWDGEKYVDMVDRTTPIEITALHDLEMYSDIDYSGYSTEEARYELLKQGKIYLRCDTGNPGEIYDSIEFLCQTDPHAIECAVQGGDGNVFDNLCVMYTSMGGISPKSNSTVQNCEVGWVGGAVMNFGDFGSVGVVRVGDCISVGRSKNIGGVNNFLINNYCHHSYDQGIALEVGPGWEDDTRFIESATIRGNLTENTSGGIVLADWTAFGTGWGDALLFKNITIEDNYIMYSGYGWSHLTAEFDWGVAGPANNGNTNIMFGFPVQAGEGILVKDNVFFLSRYALVSNKSTAQARGITFSGNTYVQKDGGTIAEWALPGNEGTLTYLPCDSNAVQTVAEVLGDMTAKMFETNNSLY